MITEAPFRTFVRELDRLGFTFNDAVLVVSFAREHHMEVAGSSIEEVAEALYSEVPDIPSSSYICVEVRSPNHSLGSFLIYNRSWELAADLEDILENELDEEV